MTEKPPLDRHRFDAMLTEPEPVVIWTADALGRRIGTSADFIRDTLAKEPNSPIKKIGGRLCAVEADLIAFFRAYPTQTH